MVTGRKHTVFLTGSVSLGRLAPELYMIHDGFAHPPMVTTALIRIRRYHMRVRRGAFFSIVARGEMLAYEKDYGGHHGYATPDVEDEMDRSERGVVMTGSPELAFQAKVHRPDTTVVVMRSAGSKLPWYFGRLSRIEHKIIDVDSVNLGEPGRVYEEIRALLDPAAQ